MTEQKKREYIRNSCLYQEELDNFFELPEEEQKKLIKRAEERITELEPNESKLAQEVGADTLAIAFTDEIDDLDESRINDFYLQRAKWYFDSKRFFEKPEAEELLKEYGVLPVDKEGKYITTGDYDYIGRNLIRRQFKDLSYSTEEKAEKLINQLWEDKTQFLTDERLRELSEARNGIGFKEFLFCEEYIKTGKVTKTCESLGIGRTTCYDYLKKEEVKKYLEERRKEIKEESDYLMKTGFNDCFTELHRLATKDSCIQDHDKIKAIDCYLRHYEQSIYKDNQQIS